MRRFLVALPLAVAVALAALAAACGNGGSAAIPTTTLTPTSTATPTSTSSTSPGSTASPSPGSSSSSSPSASPTPGTVTLSPTPGTSPPPAGTAITDAQITATIYHDFGLTPLLMQAGIRVRVHHRVVYLSGTVTSKEIKSKAEQLAVGEMGVTKVISSIVVKAEGSGGY